jgi:hypothetical protein
LIGRTSRRASKIESATAAKTKAAISSAVFQIFPLSGAKAADSGCSTNTLHFVVGTTAHALSTLRWRRFSPMAEPVAAEDANALSTWGSFSRSG